jgi:hypothetical protein
MMTEPNTNPYLLSLHAQKVIEERRIKIEWIEYVLSNPCRRMPDPSDLELEHAVQVIKENDNRVLRIIYNKCVDPVRIVTAYFDRNLRGKL